MRKNDAVFLFIMLFFSVYLYVYFKLSVNVSVWINDLYSCYSVMDTGGFFISHTNVFFYLFLFSVMSGYLLKMVIKGFYNIHHYYVTEKAINSASVLHYKNIVVIDSDHILSFNFSRKIILSTGFLKKLKRDEKRAIYYHEIGHLKHLDGLRYLIADTVLSLLPEKIKGVISKQFVIISEVYADRVALKKVSKKTLLETVLKIKEFNLLTPSGYNFVHDRFHFVIDEKSPPVPKTVIFPTVILYVITVLIYLYKTCFCGVMG